MKRLARPVIFAVAALSLAAGGCSALKPGSSDPDIMPIWVQDRMAADITGRKAPQSVPLTTADAAGSARLDRRAVELIVLRDEQTQMIEELLAEDARDSEDFAARGRRRNTAPVRNTVPASNRPPE